MKKYVRVVDDENVFGDEIDDEIRCDDHYVSPSDLFFIHPSRGGDPCSSEMPAGGNGPQALETRVHCTSRSREPSAAVAQ